LYKIPARTHFIGQNLIYVPECHSTNTLLSELNDNSPSPDGTILITDHQIAGRGQRGNSWEAEKGKNLTFSVLLRPDFLPPADQFQLNMAISLAVAAALQFDLSPPIKLKWPNDIWILDRKLGGILIENQIQGQTLIASIVGIGLNINQENFSNPNAISLYQISRSFLDLQVVLDRLAFSLETEYHELKSARFTDLKKRYLASLYKFGEPHRFQARGETFVGSIIDVDGNGRLYIEKAGSTRAFAHQEVKFMS